MFQLRSLCLTCLTLFCLLLASPACLHAMEGGVVQSGQEGGLSAVSFEAASPVMPAGTEAGLGVEPSLASGQDIFVEAAPVRDMPEQVMLRAEYQPAPSEPALLM